MATSDDARRIAMALPETTETVDGHRGGAVWRTKRGVFLRERPPSQTDLRQLDALGRSWPDGVILSAATEDEQVKSALIETRPEVFFTIPHFDGYPAVLLRLDAIDLQLLTETITDAWLVKAPPAARKAWLTEHGLR